MSRESLLVIDDDPHFRKAVRRHLEKLGYDVRECEDGDAALRTLDEDDIDLVLSDIKMPGLDGIELIRRIRERHPDVECIAMTGFGNTEYADEALDAGAFWYLPKEYRTFTPFSRCIERALAARATRIEASQLRRQLEQRYSFENIVGESEGLRRVLDLVDKVADTDATVLVLGESGVGKELVARALHYRSPRSERPFVAVNCGAIPEELLESELFGHVRGAFTGAHRTRVGRFRAADTGTIFLDEIGDMSPNLQTKLLRVVQEREFEPVGSSQTEKVDVRIIAATNQDLQQMIRDKTFREDLYFRLAVLPVLVPPLRERREDIDLLTDHFLRLLGPKYPQVEGITDPARKRLREFSWPGNIRELEGTIERLVVLKRQGWIDEPDLPPEMRPAERGLTAPRYALPSDGADLGQLVGDFERNLILQALEQTDWNKNRAAQLLGLKRTTLVEKIRTKGIEREDP